MSKIITVHKAKTGHGNKCGRIQMNALELSNIVGSRVIISVHKIDQVHQR